MIQARGQILGPFRNNNQSRTTVVPDRHCRMGEKWPKPGLACQRRIDAPVSLAAVPNWLGLHLFDAANHIPHRSIEGFNHNSSPLCTYALHVHTRYRYENFGLYGRRVPKHRLTIACVDRYCFFRLAIDTCYCFRLTFEVCNNTLRKSSRSHHRRA